MTVVDKSIEYQKMYKWMRSNIKDCKRIVFIVPDEVKIIGLYEAEQIYNKNIYVLPSNGVESGLIETRSAGLVIYIDSEVHNEFEKLLKSFNMPLVNIKVGVKDNSKLETGAILELSMPLVNKTSIKYVVNELIEMYKSIDSEMKKYKSNVVKESAKLVNTNKDWRALWYSMTRLPYRSRLAKWLLPEKNRKQKA